MSATETIEIELTESEFTRLREIAGAYGMEVEEWARIAILMDAAGDDE